MVIELLESRVEVIKAEIALARARMNAHGEKSQKFRYGDWEDEFKADREIAYGSATGQRLVDAERARDQAELIDGGRGRTGDYLEEAMGGLVTEDRARISKASEDVRHSANRPFALNAIADAVVEHSVGREAGWLERAVTWVDGGEANMSARARALSNSRHMRNYLGTRADQVERHVSDMLTRKQQPSS